MFLMQTGLTMICAGCVRVNKVQNTLLKNFLNACNLSLGFYTASYACAFGGTSNGSTIFIGSDNFFLVGVNNDSFWLLHFAFCETSATIVGQAIICTVLLLLLLVGGGIPRQQHRTCVALTNDT